jgi:hypothetical protein
VDDEFLRKTLSDFRNHRMDLAMKILQARERLQQLQGNLDAVVAELALAKPFARKPGSEAGPPLSSPSSETPA